MLRILNIKNWSKLGREEDLEKKLEQRPIILLSQFAVFAVIAVVSHTVIDFFLNSPETVLLDAILLIIMAFVYFLNESLHHNTAKYLFLGSLNIGLLIHCNLMPKATGAYLLYFPIIGSTFIFLGKEKAAVRCLFIGFSVLSLFTLEVTQYQLFGPVSINNGLVTYSFIVNLITATIAFSVAINYLLQMNTKAEEQLTQSRNRFKKIAREIKKKNQVLE